MFVGLWSCIPVLIRYNQHALQIARGIRLENLSDYNLGFYAKHRYLVSTPNIHVTLTCL